MFHQFVRFCFPRVGLNPSNPGLQCSFPLLFLTWFHQYERGAGKPHESWLLGNQNLTELGYHMTSDCMQMQGRMCNVHKLDYACRSCFPDFSLSLLHFCQILENVFFILVLLLEVPFLPNILVYMMKPVILFLYTIFWSLNFNVEKILLCLVSNIIKVEYCLSNENIHLLFQRSKLTFLKSRLLATFNCKMVAIKKMQSPKTNKREGEDTSWHITRRKITWRGRTFHNVLHDGLMRRTARFQHFTLLQ